MNVQEAVSKFRGCQTVEELAAYVIAAKSAANKIEDPGVRFSVHERIDLVASCEVVRLLPERTSEPIAIGPGDPDPPPPPPPTKALPSEEQRRKDFDAWWATLEVPQAWKKQGPAFVLQAWEKAVELYAWGPDRLALLNIKKALREVVDENTNALHKHEAPISVDTAIAYVEGIRIEFDRRLEALT